MVSPQAAPELTPAQEEALLGSMTYDVRESGSPLRRFRGLCHYIKPKQRVGKSFDGTPRNQLELKFQFSNMTGPDGTGFPEATTPYPWGTGELTFFRGADDQPSASSAFGIWSKSITDILGEGALLPAVKGKTLDVAFTSGHAARKLDPKTQEWSDVEIEAFVVLAIDGKKAPDVASVPAVAGAPVPVAAAPVVAGQDINDVLAEIADGKLPVAFASVALQDERVKANQNAFSQIVIDNGATVAAALATSGKVTIDAAGIMHRVVPA